MITRTALIVNLTLVLCSHAAATVLQNREHLLPKEIERVQEAQVLDKRIDVFIKAADRRLQALHLSTGEQVKAQKKDGELWGELPTGSRAELVGDIAKILDEAITNIDDVSLRDERNPLIPKALRKLAAAATRITTQLKPLQSQSQSAAEIGSFDQLTENAESIVQAAGKLPPEVAKKGKAKGEKPAEKN
jgi:hypothetical protein